MKAILTSVLIFISVLAFTQIAWINEFHYANEGFDVNEFVEVVVRDAGEYDLSYYQVDFYNGVTGRVYKTATLDEFTLGDVVADCRFYCLDMAPDTFLNGNGGIALSYDSILIGGRATYSQFISYGGVIYAIEGPAKGLISYDVGLIESIRTNFEYSIQLTGEHFIWYGYEWTAGLASKGTVNLNQVINEAPGKFFDGLAKLEGADGICLIEGHIYTGNYNYNLDSTIRIYICMRCAEDTLVNVPDTIPMNPIFKK